MTEVALTKPTWDRTRVIPQVLVGAGGVACYHVVSGSVIALVVVCGHLLLWWFFFTNLRRASRLHQLMGEHGEKVQVRTVITPDLRPMGAGYPTWWLLPSLGCLAAIFWQPLRPWMELALWIDLARVGFHTLAVLHARAGLNHRIRLIEDPQYLGKYIDMERFAELNERAASERSTPQGKDNS